MDDLTIAIERGRRPGRGGGRAAPCPDGRRPGGTRPRRSGGGAPATGRRGDGRRRADDLVRWCRTELVPHALAEESTMYRGRRRHGPRVGCWSRPCWPSTSGSSAWSTPWPTTTDAVSAAGLARALQRAASRPPGQGERPGPAAAGRRARRLGGRPARRHARAARRRVARRSTRRARTRRRGEGHACSCGEADGRACPSSTPARSRTRSGTPRSSAPSTPCAPGSGLVLVAPHDPLPLLAQLEQRRARAFDVDYLERGPEAWRLLLVRRG